MLFFILLSQNSIGQNEQYLREEYVLKLFVDKEHFYEQNVQTSPYLVKDNVLQIYTGEKVAIELNIVSDEIASLRIADENSDPKKTINIEVTQTVKDSVNESIMLKIENATNEEIGYKAKFFAVGGEQWIETNVLSVKPNLTSYELWNDVIITLALSDWVIIR